MSAVLAGYFVAWINNALPFISISWLVSEFLLLVFDVDGDMVG